MSAGTGLVELEDALAALEPRMIALRRDIHRHPEVAWHEVRTSGLVAAELTAAGLEPRALPAGTGLICDIVGDPAGPMVGLRADLDALPIDDETPEEYRSTVEGVAHACGHDVHTTSVLGAGLALASARGRLPGRVRLLFQPAEEVVPGGALAAIDAGVLDGVARMYAVHCDPRVDVGQVALRSGPITAATDMIRVRLSGPGGHTSRPQLTVDVVAALADVVVRVPSLLSRRVDARDSLSLVWGRIAAGTAANVIPERGEAGGTLRVLDRASWDRLPDLVPGLVEEIAAPYGAQVEIDYVRGVPPAVNDVEATEGFRRAASGLLGEPSVLETPQSMGAEDFAWILSEVPGVLCRLGVRRPGATEAPDLHRGDFDVDERAIGYGSRVLSAVVVEALERLR